MECEYIFPIDKSTILAKFEASIDGKTIMTNVKEKEQAKEIYDDAVAGGNVAVIAKRKKKEETLSLKLGNLAPGQEATLKLQIVNSLEIVGSHYMFSLPMAFYPDYSKFGVDVANFAYEFTYAIKIIAKGTITSLSLPTSAEVTNKNDDKTEITIECPEPSRSMDLYYRTADMLVPELLYTETADGKEVACSVSLVPTFEPVAPQDAFEIVKDEKPEAMKLGDGSDFHFIFIVDRSGSMSLNNRMRIAREACVLFMRSLPEGCKFSIISFGSQFSPLRKGDVLDYNDQNKDAAIAEINEFDDNFGGTRILEPL